MHNKARQGKYHQKELDTLNKILIKLQPQRGYCNKLLPKSVRLYRPDISKDTDYISNTINLNLFKVHIYICS